MLTSIAVSSRRICMPLHIRILEERTVLSAAAPYDVRSSVSLLVDHLRPMRGLDGHAFARPMFSPSGSSNTFPGLKANNSPKTFAHSSLASQNLTDGVSQRKHDRLDPLSQQQKTISTSRLRDGGHVLQSFFARHTFFYNVAHLNWHFAS